MAVARISAPKSWFLSAADRVGDLPKLQRELLCAAGLAYKGREVRRTLLAELTADEARELHARIGDERTARAVTELEAAEEYERTRVRPGTLIQGRAKLVNIPPRGAGEETTQLSEGASKLSTVTRTRRSSEDWDALALEMIETGQKISDPAVAERIGTNAAAVRVALARRGFSGDLEPLDVTPLATSGGPKALAKRIAKRRQEKAPWWRLVVEANMSYPELRALLSKYGYSPKGESTNGASAS